MIKTPYQRLPIIKRFFVWLRFRPKFYLSFVSHILCWFMLGLKDGLSYVLWRYTLEKIVNDHAMGNYITTDDLSHFFEG